MPRPRNHQTRFLYSHFELMMPSIPRTTITTGSSKTTPKPMTIRRMNPTSCATSARYVTFEGAKELRTRMYRGSAYNAAATPRAKKKMVATISGRVSFRSLRCRPGLTNHQICWITTGAATRSEEHTSELPSHLNLVCRLLLEKKKTNKQDLHRKIKKNKKDNETINKKKK